MNNQKLQKIANRCFHDEQAQTDIEDLLDLEKYTEEVLKEVISTIYGADYIKDKKADMLVDEIAFKFGYK